MDTSAPDLRRIKYADLPPAQQAAVELERRRRQRLHIPESQKCADSFTYFVLNYVQIYDATEKKWIPFDLWPEQQDIADHMPIEKLIIVLKARQLGMTWLVLAYALWLMVFYPTATILLFSLRDTEAVYLLSNDRLKGMYKRLPAWLMMRERLDDPKPGMPEFDWIPRSVEIDGGHMWQLGNGSNARAFPTSAGDSYTATLAIVDEADLVPDLSALLLRVKPTIDGGGQLFLISKVDKSQPMSEFKTIYRAAKKKLNSWFGIFLPWWVRPSRTAEWYATQKRDAESRIGGTDDLYENYPATDTEALAPKQLDKRLPYNFLARIYSEEAPVAENALHLPALRVYMPPRKGKKYVIGADPAEGNPNSDDSAMQIADVDSGAQCAVLSGKYDVDVLAVYIEQLSDYYNAAPALVERNNHGHAVIANLRNSRKKKKVRLINGQDGKPGWQSNKRTKVILYDDLAQTITSEDCMVFDPKTFEQLSSIEGSTLLAPSGMNDDEADAYALVQKARMLKAPEPIRAGVAGTRNTVIGLPPRDMNERPIGAGFYQPSNPAAPQRIVPSAMPQRASTSVIQGRVAAMTKKRQRIAIIGWPGTGKTTLGKKIAAELNLPYRSTDETLEMNLDWSAASAEVATWLDGDNWVIEGVALPRALRKWRDAHPGQRPPVDRVIRLTTVHRTLEDGAVRMGKGLDTVLAALRDWLPQIEDR